MQDVCVGDHNYARTQEATVSLLSLNVCGLKTKVDLGIIQERVAKCDIVCLVETKANDVDAKWFPDFVAFSAKKKYGKSNFGGTHGIAVLVTLSIANHVKVINDLTSDCVLWLHVSEQAFQKSFIVGSVYVPHERSCHFNDSMFDSIMHDITELAARHKDTPFIMLGDFNARTGEASDLVEIDTAVIGETGIDMNLFDNCSEQKAELLGIDLARQNQDKQLNKHGWELLKCLKTADMKIINGRFGQDKGIGQFTCASANGKSTIDYAISSTSLLPNISGFQVDILDKCISDVHSAIQLKLQFPSLLVGGLQKHASAEFPSSSMTIMNWENCKATDYKGNFNMSEIDRFKQTICGVRNTEPSQESIDSIASDLSSLLTVPAQECGMQRNVRHTRRKTKENQWFNKECHEKRREYLCYKNKVNKNKLTLSDDRSRETLNTKAKEYKKLISTTKQGYFKNMRRKLKNLKVTRPRDYWNILTLARTGGGG